VPRELPALGTAYTVKVEKCLDLTRTVELSLLVTAGRHWTPSKTDLAYESAFLRFFTEWEMFLEECTIRFMRGYTSGAYVPMYPQGTTVSPSIAAARAKLLGNRRYLMWYDPVTNIRRVKKWLDHCPVEVICLSAQSWLEQIAAVRHRIAHRSDDARSKFDSACMALAGRRFVGSSAGRFLRSFDPSSGHRRIEGIAQRMMNLALQVAP
jgi:hypothetical protein